MINLLLVISGSVLLLISQLRIADNYTNLTVCVLYFIANVILFGGVLK